jgi:outer membrane immunogenic protein
MKRIFILFGLAAVASTSIAATSAMAADLAVKQPVYTKAPAYVEPMYNWTGFYVGADWQMAHWVFGLEGDYSWSNISGSSQSCGPITALHACGTNLDSFGTFRGRIGYAAGQTGNVLLYATGGLAVGDVHGWDALTPASGSSFEAGWTVGAGVEFAFAPQWTAKFEYLYADLGKKQLFNIVPTVPETVSFTTNILRAGINYKFGGPVVAKY